MGGRLLLCLLSSAFGQVSRFELTPAAPSATIGAPVELAGTATFPARFKLDPALAGQPTGSFEVLSVELGTPRAQGETASVPVRLKVAAFALGEQTLPALRWSLRGDDGAQDSLSSPPIKLDVTGPKVAENSDILDIAGPLAPRVWPWVLLLALAAAGAGAWAWRTAARRRGAGAQEAAPAPDPRTADEIALDELQKLAASELPVKEYYDRLSDILRLYLERRYGVPALRLTTGDLARRMVRTPASPEARSLSKALLDRCDLVKFARHRPSTEERRKDLNAVGHAVVLTREPRPEPILPAPGDPA